MKKIVLFALITVFAAVSVFAQGMPMTGWASPQSVSTQGLVRSPADDFIRPDSYAEAGISDWFSMISFNSANAVRLGYAKNSEKLFFGIYYSGNLWGGVADYTYTERSVPWDGGNKTVPVYTAVPTGDLFNRVGVLLGLGNMGFRFSFYSSLYVFDQKNVQINLQNYSSYLRETGRIRPQLAWSMTEDLTEKGIRPNVTLDLDFYRDYTKSQQDTSSNTIIGNSQNYFSPMVQVGLGGFTLGTVNNFSIVADLDWLLVARIYDNEYGYMDGTSYKTSKISGLNSTGTLTENTYIYNTVTPSISGSWDVDNFSFRALLNLEISFGTETETEMGLSSSNKLEKDGSDATMNSFHFNPDINLAMQWKANSKFALNAGGRFNFRSIGSTTTESKTYLNGNAVDNSSTKTVANEFGTTATTLTIGVTLAPVENVIFEATTGASRDSINFFGNLTTFYNLLVSLKF